MTIRRSIRKWLDSGKHGRKLLRKRVRANTEQQRDLLLEPLEARVLMDGAGLVRPFPDGLNYPESEVRQLISDITTTGSTVAAYPAGDVSTATSISGPLVKLPGFRSDTSFAGINGTGYSTVILDTGIDLNHPFFGSDSNADGVADRIVYQYDFADNDSDASDVNNHGSNVASIVASSDSFYTGMAPGAGIVALKVFKDSGAGSFSYIEKALQWVVANSSTYNIASVNMSLSDNQNWSSAATLPYYGISDELAALAAMRVIVVSAAGNDFYTFNSVPGVAYPAADPNSVAVSAVYSADFGARYWGSGAADYTTGADRVTAFSQRHRTLTDVMAPGAMITGASRDGGTVAMGGTSQASPHIAGIAVLAQQLAKQELGRRLTQSEFVGLMQNSGKTIFDGDDENGNVTNTQVNYQRVDVYGLGNAILALAGKSVGPRLISINPNAGEIFNPDRDPGVNTGQDNTLNVAPRELTFRFDGRGDIDESTLSGIRITRSGLDGQFGTSDDVVVTPGYIGLGESSRIVVARFAETLPDDLYRIEIFGFDDALKGITGLRDKSGNLFVPTDAGTDRDTMYFQLELGALITAVVPQPVSRAQQVRLTGTVTGGNFQLTFNGSTTGQIPYNATAAQVKTALESLPNITPDQDVLVTASASGWLVEFHGRYGGLQAPLLVGVPGGLTGTAPGIAVDQTSTLVQARNQVVVYFNEDDLDSSSATDPNYYQLIFTNDTTRNRGGVDAGSEDDQNVYRPTRVTYYPGADKAVLTFASDLDKLPSGEGTYRLRIGTSESVPLAPNTLTPATDPGSKFGNALGISLSQTQALVVSSTIQNTTPYELDFPGAEQEVGQREIRLTTRENHLNQSADTTAGITTFAYTFDTLTSYGTNHVGQPLYSAITTAQKERAREVFAFYSEYMGVDFVEVPKQDQADFWIVTGDLRPNGGTSGPGGTLGIANSFGLEILDSAENWDDSFGATDSAAKTSWFAVAMHEIGHLLGLGHASEQPPDTIMGGLYSDATLGGESKLLLNTPVEPVFPGQIDVLHGRNLYRPESNDIDLYKFTVPAGVTGVFTAETIAERKFNSSQLDSVLTLYRERTDANGRLIREVISQNDDYFSNDSLVQMELGEGTYYLGVSASGNGNYDPTIEDTGLGGVSQGDYDLKLNFRPAVSASIVDTAGTALDGDADGTPGGVYNFWFQTRGLNRVLELKGNGTTITEGQTVTVTDGNGLKKVFEFSADATLSSATNVRVPYSASSTANDLATALATAISGATGFNSPTFAAASGTQVTLQGERSVQLSANSQSIEVHGKTLFVDKTAPLAADGSLARPFSNIAGTAISAFGSAMPNDIVRIVGNGGTDRNSSTENDASAYEIGFGGPLNSALSDGYTMDVPKGVTVMIDAGAVFKMRRARIGVGSSTASVDRSGSSIQVLGTPVESVYFTSYNNENLGIDTNSVPTTPLPGDWGGIDIRQDVDRGQGRFLYEQEGIFLNYINHAEMTYGGGNVYEDSRYVVFNPVRLTEARPTITYNRITLSADAAISADPNSFEETNFNAPNYQISGAFTADYDRVGPQVRSNRLIGNTMNAMFVRIETPAGSQLTPLVVSARFDDTDITHVITDGLQLQGTPGGPIAREASPPADLISLAPQPGGTLAAGSYTYVLTYVDRNGFESAPSKPTAAVAIAAGSGTIRLTNLPPTTAPFISRRLYRSQAGSYVLVTQLDGTSTSYVDDGTTAGGPIPSAVGSVVRRARLDASLVIDPDTVVKLGSGRIEMGFGTSFIAEGLDGHQVVMTSVKDDRYGAGGTFDTNNNTSGDQPQPGDWGGIYFGELSSGSVDHALITYAGGINTIEGTLTGFNAVEIHQAQVRIANSVLENNASGIGGPASPGRFGRGFHEDSVIFVRASQPVIVDNIIRNNADSDLGTNIPAISINANALDASYVTDMGRSRGTTDRFTVFVDNQGPLVRLNKLSGNERNGIEIRGETLNTESVWDDTDIVHILPETVYIPDFQHEGGLRLESSPSESLVVKLTGNGGLVATGRPLDITDRVGGMLHIVGMPGFPVILTSLSDDSVGAGFDPTGQPQVDTNGNGPSLGQPGDWGSVRIDEFAHDRNVEIATELEAADVTAPGVNATPSNAQFLGAMAPDEESGDDHLRLGYRIQGLINTPGDVDVYSFTAKAGTEVWFDIDKTTQSLDTVIELLDASGNIIAQSDNSIDESAGTLALYFDPYSIPANHVNVLEKSTYYATHTVNPAQPRDDYTLNPRDAGMRVVLPGDSDAPSNTYHIRVRSSNIDPLDPSANQDDLQDPGKLFAGKTAGNYQLNLRLRETDEFAGSTVRYADIRFATNGIEVLGQPLHSYLTGEATERLINNSDQNDSVASADALGNLMNTDRAALSIAGNLAISTDVDFFSFSTRYDSVQNGGSDHIPTIFDLDYSDGLGRANTTLSVFDNSGRLVLTGMNSNIADDQSGPLNGIDMTDLSRGSAGTLDPYIGPVEMPSGTYTVAVTSDAQIANQLLQTRVANPPNTNVRLEPVNSVQRIAEDRFEQTTSAGFSTAVTPIVSNLFGTGAQGNANDARVPYTLSDVVLFVNVDYQADGSELRTVDPFTGYQETVISRSSSVRFDDIAMRPDGQLYGFEVNESYPDSDSNTGDFYQLDTAGNVGVQRIGDNGIITYENDGQGNAVVANNYNNNRIGDGIEIEALAFGGTDNNTLRLIGVGNRGNGPALRPGNQYADNIIYQFDSTSGGATSSPQSNRSNNTEYTGAGTQIRERGRIDTAAAGGGFITGLAFAGNRLFAVSNAGRLFEVSNFNADSTANSGTLVAALTDAGGSAIVFAGLTAGPRNLEGGLYSDMLFGIDVQGRVFAFDTAGNFQPVFVNGNYYISTGVANPTGLAFSNLDVNLWHISQNRETDSGHGEPQPFDGSRIESNDADGGLSFYFGYENRNNSNNTLNNFFDSTGYYDVGRLDGTRYNTYDFPGGAQGRLETNTFDLSAYSANDSPVLYFNYYLATDNTSDYLDDGTNHMRDSFRVFVGGDDGVWDLVATNNSARDTGSEGRDEYDYGKLTLQECNYNANIGMTYECGQDDYDYGVGVQQLFDVGDNGAPNAWRQARISLAPWAGQNNLKLRFEFATAGAWGPNESSNATAFQNTVGDELKVIPGSELRDGQKFTITTGATPRTFEFDMDATLVPSSGKKLAVGNTLAINGVVFTFEKVPGTYARGILFSEDYSADEVAQSIQAAVQNAINTGSYAGLNSLQLYRNGNRLNLYNPSTTDTVTVVSTAVPFEPDVANPTTVKIPVHAGMTRAQVRDAIRTVLATTYNFAGDANVAGQAANTDVVPYNEDVIYIRGRSVTDPGPLGLTQRYDQNGNLVSGMQGDQFGSFLDGLTTPGARRGQNNRYEGVYVDDVIIGLAERGEMVISAASDDTSFRNQTVAPGVRGNLSPDEVGVGNYQLEMRYAAKFGRSLANSFPNLCLIPGIFNCGDTRAYDSNDRLAQQATLVAPAGPDISDGQTFVISDGVDTLTFEYDDDILTGSASDGVGDGVTSGNVAIVFSSNDTAASVASKIRDAVNSAQSQAVLEVSAALSDGTLTGTSGTILVNLFGTVAGDRFGGSDLGEVDATAATNDVIYFGTDTPDREDLGDQNRRREQGQVLIQSNIVRDAAEFGIVVDNGQRNRSDLVPMAGSLPHMGPVQNLRNINNERFVPGVTVINNVVDSSVQGGIRFSGDPLLVANQAPAVPFGRVVNNTVYGRGTNDTGIYVTDQASPTILNNIVANVQSGIAVDGSSSTTVVSHNLYQNVTSNTGGTFAEIIGSSDPLFVDPKRGNFYLKAGSRAIDNSLNQLDDRFFYAKTIKEPMGLPESPILAPERDVLGQLRSDDTASDPTGLGASVFKDRGAIDRADTDGPIAQLLFPLDNDLEGKDTDSTKTSVQLLEGTLDHFAISLQDPDGTGPDVNTVTSLQVTITEDGRALTEGIDYSFGFSTTNRTILLTPLSGIWKPGSAYEITLNNRDRFVVIARGGESVSDGQQFSITDPAGSNVVFEYESGYSLYVPETLTLTVPAAGAGAGGVRDGDTFTVTHDTPQGQTTTIFEFDSNNNFVSSHVRIPFTNSFTQDDLANSITDKLSQAGLALSPRNLGNGVVHLGVRTSLFGQPLHDLMLPTGSPLTMRGVNAGIDDGQTFVLVYGSQAFTFEFDADGTYNPANEPITFQLQNTNLEIADAIVSAVSAANAKVDSALALRPTHLRDGHLHLAGTAGYVVDTTTNLVSTDDNWLKQNRTSGRNGTIELEVPAAGLGGVRDGLQFSVRKGTAAPVIFEFDSDYTSSFGTIPVTFNGTESADEMAAIVKSVLEADTTLGLSQLAIAANRVTLPAVTHNLRLNGVFFPTSQLTESGEPGVTDSVAITVPVNGSADIVDGSTFTIQRGNDTPVTFEFNNDGNTIAGNVIILFDNTDTNRNVLAQAIVNVINGVAGLGLRAESVTGSGVIRLNESAQYHLTIPGSTALTRNGIEGGSVPVVYVPDQSFTGDNMAGAIVNAINFSDSTVRARSRAGSTIFLSSPTAVSGITVLAGFTDTDGRLDGIKDIAGNDLQPNRLNNETQFTITLPGADLDFGDAPETSNPDIGRYPTLESFDAARHVIVSSSAHLGSGVDAETDGQPSSAATGDDSNPVGGDDEDGVVFVDPLNPNLHSLITVTSSGPALLDAWMDFNHDGDWNDVGEKIFDGVAVSQGVNNLTLQIPVTAVPGQTFARFRLSSGGGLFPTGIAIGGEVEDYQVTIIAGTPPVAVSDAYATNEDADPPLDVPAKGILTNDMDAEGQALSVYSVNGAHLNSGQPITLASGAILTVYDNGRFVYDTRSSNSIQSMRQGETKTETYTYRANDNPICGAPGDPPCSPMVSLNSATVTVTVTGMNDAPVAVADTKSIGENDSETVDVIINDTDADHDTTLSLKAASVSIQSVTFNGNPIDPKPGTATQSGNKITFDPGTGFDFLKPGESAIVVIGYTVIDDTGLEDAGTLTITVNGFKELPVAVNDGDPPFPYNATEDTIYNASVSVLNNDTSMDNLTLTAIIVNGPSHARTFSLGTDGLFTYEPVGNYTGYDTFTYKAFDGSDYSNTATATIWVAPVNDAPNAVNDRDYTTREDTVLNVTAPGVLANDSDTDGDSITAEVVTGPQHSVQFQFASDGSFRYLPKANYNGTDTFTYRVFDGTDYSAVATATITVTAENDTPVAVADAYTAALNTTLSITAPGVLSNDTDPEDGQPSRCAIAPGGMPKQGILALNSNGSFTYTPATGFMGQDSFQYVAIDSSNLTSAPVTVTITVQNPYPWRNPTNQYDVNADGSVSPIDALLLINRLNRYGVEHLPVPPIAGEEPPPYYDVVVDNILAPNDVLAIINYLNSLSSGEGEAAYAAEGEQSVNNAPWDATFFVGYTVVAPDTAPAASSPVDARGSLFAADFDGVDQATAGRAGHTISARAGLQDELDDVLDDIVRARTADGASDTNDLDNLLSRWFG